jgi:hypothetical protein
VDLALYFLLGYCLPFALILLLAFPLLHVARWSWLDWVALALPGLVWTGLVYFDERGRGCSNVVTEPLLLAFLIACAGGLRSRAPTRLGPVLPTIGLFLIGLILCFCIYLFFPRTGE